MAKRKREHDWTGRGSHKGASRFVKAESSRQEIDEAVEEATRLCRLPHANLPDAESPCDFITPPDREIEIRMGRNKLMETWAGLKIAHEILGALGLNGMALNAIKQAENSIWPHVIKSWEAPCR